MGRIQLPFLGPTDPFPPTSLALTETQGANGLLAAGHDLSVQRLLMAYSQGIFPWFSDGQPVLWWSPSPRMVLQLADFKISRSLAKTLRKTASDPQWQVTMDTAFDRVMAHCAAPRRSADGNTEPGTWIVPAMQQAYLDLHQAGFAHSIETWLNDELVGGLYCVAIGQMVYGESMFARKTDASKLALAHLIQWLSQSGVKVIDCQQNTRHLSSLGGVEVSRGQFEAWVSEGCSRPALPWAPQRLRFMFEQNDQTR